MKHEIPPWPHPDTLNVFHGEAVWRAFRREEAKRLTRVIEPLPDRAADVAVRRRAAIARAVTR